MHLLPVYGHNRKEGFVCVRNDGIKNPPHSAIQESLHVGRPLKQPIYSGHPSSDSLTIFCKISPPRQCNSNQPPSPTDYNCLQSFSHCGSQSHRRPRPCPLISDTTAHICWSFRRLELLRSAHNGREGARAPNSKQLERPGKKVGFASVAVAVAVIRLFLCRRHGIATGPIERG